MEYREAVCPKCEKTMQVPDDLEKVICMYCGETFMPEDPAKEETAVDVSARDREKEAALEGFPQLLLSVKDGLKSFKRDTYEETFRSMYRENIDFLTHIENMYLQSPQGERDILDICDRFVAAAAGEVQGLSRKSARERKMMDYNMTMVVYVFPQILEYKGKSSKLLADSLLAAWNRQFQNAKLGMATFEEINAGFRRKLCYITTAVCQSLDKTEDCQELKLLKDYRDRVLIREKDGKELIREYYDIAPTIVKRIEKSPDKDRVYRLIYTRYIHPCIDDIKRGDYVKCRQTYTQMVKTLQEEYMR